MRLRQRVWHLIDLSWHVDDVCGRPGVDDATLTLAAAAAADAGGGGDGTLSFQGGKGKGGKKAPLGSSRSGSVNNDGGQTVEQRYQKKTQLEHILLRPDTYSESYTGHPSVDWIPYAYDG